MHKKPKTRSTTRASTQKTNEEAIEKKRTTKEAQVEPKKRRKLVIQHDTDQDEDISQFKVVIHPPKSPIDILCQKIRNGDLNDVKDIDFNKFSKEEQDKIEESFYAMMAEFKYTPLELAGQMPKELSKIVDEK